MELKAVFFDIGETLINEGRIYGEWADWLGVPRHTFLAVLGAVIARGEPHLNVFEHFRPGFDLAAEEAARREAGVPNGFDERDVYPDAARCLAALRAHGYLVGVAGNQPKEAAARFTALGLEHDYAAMSADWGVEKPSPAFFDRLLREADLPASAILYVGDRVDNDVVPASAAGLRTAFLLRGPWAHVQSADPRAAAATHTVPSLDALTDLLTARPSLP